MSTPRDPARIRSLFRRVFGELSEFPSNEVQKVDLVLEGGEFEVALANLITQLIEFGIEVPGPARRTIDELAELTGLDARYLTRLDQ